MHWPILPRTGSEIRNELCFVRVGITRRPVGNNAPAETLAVRTITYPSFSSLSKGKLPVFWFHPSRFGHFAKVLSPWSDKPSIDRPLSYYISGNGTMLGAFRRAEKRGSSIDARFSAGVALKRSSSGEG